jgi:thiol-disulfide isomerase/thioredoxin
VRIRFAAVLALAQCLAADSMVNPAERQRAPEFELKDSAGQIARMADYEGKVVLINFWASWCVPCKLEVPWLIEFERKYGAQGFAVLGISLDEKGWDAARPYAEKMGINYRVLMGDPVTAFKYGKVEALPATFLVDRDRRVAAIHFGLVNRKRVEQEIRKLLE